MSWLRRSRLPEDLREIHAAFVRVTEPVERAKEAVVEALPQARYPGRPLEDALAAFDDDLARAELAMPAWRHRDVESIWSECETGLTQARARGVALARAGAPAGFESLVETIQTLLDPLEPFERAEDRFRDLRR